MPLSGFLNGPAAPFFHETDGALFLRREGVRLLSATLGISEREALVRLFDAGIWPERFRRNRGIFTARQMADLLRSRVLIVGCGGLGGHTAALLARTGIGSLRLCDPDVFEESNLNRQMFCTERTLGLPKAAATRDALLDIAPHLDIDARIAAADGHSLPELLEGVDVAVDCLDSIPARMTLERCAADAGTAFVHGSVAREEGFAFLAAERERRLSAMYPEDSGSEPSPAASACAAAGTALLMAMLTLRRLLEPERGASPLLHLDCSIPELEAFLT